MITYGSGEWLQNTPLLCLSEFKSVTVLLLCSIFPLFCLGYMYESCVWRVYKVSATMQRNCIASESTMMGVTNRAYNHENYIKLSCCIWWHWWHWWHSLFSLMSTKMYCHMPARWGLRRTMHLGSGQRRDTDQGPFSPLTDYLKFKNTDQHWPILLRQGEPGTPQYHKVPSISVDFSVHPSGCPIHLALNICKELQSRKLWELICRAGNR